MMHVELVGNNGLGFTMSPKGSAIYDNEGERATFERLQRALNTFAGKFMPDVPKIRVDGKLGSKTLGLRNTAYSRAAAHTGVPFVPRTSIEDLANNALIDAIFVEGATARVPKVKLPPAPEEIVAPKAEPGIAPPPGVAVFAKKRKFSPYYILAGGGAVALLAVGVMWFRRRQ
jgi:hypothetical protein